MNEIFVQHLQKSTPFLVAIDYYTIFYFFLQLSLDIFRRLIIMILKRAEKSRSQRRTKARIRVCIRFRERKKKRKSF